MGGNESKQASASAASTSVSAAQNSTVNLVNIYELHQEHKSQLIEINKNIDFKFSAIGAIVIITLVLIIARRLYKKCKKRLEEAVRVKVLQLIEEGKAEDPKELTQK